MKQTAVNQEQIACVQKARVTKMGSGKYAIVRMEVTYHALAYRVIDVMVPDFTEKIK